MYLNQNNKQEGSINSISPDRSGSSNTGNNNSSQDHNPFDESIDWNSIGNFSPNTIKVIQDTEFTFYYHRMFDKGWYGNPFQPPFKGFTEYLTSSRFVQKVNGEAITAMSMWCKKILELLKIVDTHRLRRQISSIAHVSQYDFLLKVKEIIQVFKGIRNFPIRIINGDTIRNFFPYCDENDEFAEDMVHFIKAMSRCNMYEIQYVPHLELRNFEIVTIWPDLSHQEKSYGKGEMTCMSDIE